MQTSRWIAGGVLVLVLACGGLGSQAETPREATASSSNTEDLPKAAPNPQHGRAGHTGVLLPDGRVLFAGGHDSPAAAEVYVPAREGWEAVGALAQPRFGHAMASLPGGKVLLVGGEDPAMADPNADPTGLTHAEVFDPATNQFAAVAPSGSAFLRPKAVALPGGHVLVVNCEVGEVRAERYDPSADTWSSASSPGRCAEDDDLVAVDGGVLIGSGGAAYELERYDAAADTWSKTAPAPRKRTNRLAVLPDGRVLATGRRSQADSEPDAAVFDPKTNTWEPTTAIPRTFETIDHASFALVASGDQVWRIGGSSGRPPKASAEVEVWSAEAGTWTAVDPLKHARLGASATALPGGQVLVYGGRGQSGGPPLATAEVLGR